MYYTLTLLGLTGLLLIRKSARSFARHAAPHAVSLLTPQLLHNPLGHQLSIVKELCSSTGYLHGYKNECQTSCIPALRFMVAGPARAALVVTRNCPSLTGVQLVRAACIRVCSISRQTSPMATRAPVWINGARRRFRPSCSLKQL